MKKLIKKIILGISSIFFVISCSSLSAKEYFEKGRYLEALQATANELKDNKKALSIEEENIVASRVSEIERSYRNKLNLAIDEKSKANAYLELWEMNNIVQKNPQLSKYMQSTSYSNSQELLNNAVNNIIRYVNIDPLNRVSDLTVYINKFREYNLQNGIYKDYYELVARRSADIYFEQAMRYENSGDLENARDNYYRAATAYSDFGNNYRGSAQKYREIKRNIDLSKANKYYEEALRNYRLESYETSRSYFERARSIFAEYSMNVQVNQIDSYITSITRTIELNKANTAYNNAIMYYNSSDFNRAKYNFEEARKIYSKYSMTLQVNQIDSYLTNLNRTKELKEAQDNYNNGLNSYQNRNFQNALSYFNKARSIYVKYGFNVEITTIDMYIKNINNQQTNSKNDSRFESYYNNAKYYERLAQTTYNYESKVSYYSKARMEYINALAYTTNSYYINEINDRISFIDSTIGTDYQIKK